PAIAPLGQAKPTTEVFRLLAAALGFDDPCFADTDEQIVRQALDSPARALRGLDFDLLHRQAWAKLNLGADYRPRPEGGFGGPGGKAQLYAPALAEAGQDGLPTFTPPRESRWVDPALVSRYPLRLLTPKAHHYLNSTFGNVASLARDAGPLV